PHYHR
ncbi:hypothetical protein D049_4112B, partial [Vibrio parahaemolyticus VPTS-2010]